MFGTPAPQFTDDRAFGMPVSVQVRHVDRHRRIAGERFYWPTEPQPRAVENEVILAHPQAAKPLP